METTTTTKKYPVNEKIRQVILESGLNASQFAEAIGVQRSTISHILSYRNRPGTEILQKITKMEQVGVLSSWGECFKRWF